MLKMLNVDGKIERHMFWKNTMAQVSAQASLQQLCAGVQPIGPCPGPLLSQAASASNGFSPLLLLLRLVIAYINDTDKHTFGRRPAPELLPSPKGLGW